MPLLRRAYEEWRAFETIDGHGSRIAPHHHRHSRGGMPRLQGCEQLARLVAPARSAARDDERQGDDGSLPRIRSAAGLDRAVSAGRWVSSAGSGDRRFVAAAARRGAEVRANTRVIAIEPKPAFDRGEDGNRDHRGGQRRRRGRSLDHRFRAQPRAQPHRDAPGRRLVSAHAAPSSTSRACFPVFILESRDDHIYGFPNFFGLRREVGLACPRSHVCSMRVSSTMRRPPKTRRRSRPC